MDGVGVRAGGRERELDARGLRYLRDGKGPARKSAPGDGIQEGGKPPLFCLGRRRRHGQARGGSTTGGAEVDGVSIKGYQHRRAGVGLSRSTSSARR